MNIPNNKKIAVLHPFLTKKGWAVSMMIYLSDLLSETNNVSFYSFFYDNKLYPKIEYSFKIKYFKNSKIISAFKIAYSIRKYDYILIWNSPMHFVWVISKILFRSKAKIIWWHHHYPWYYNENTNVYIKFKKIIELRLIKHIDLIVANSNYLESAIKKIYNRQSLILNPVVHNDYNLQPLPKSNDNCRQLFSYGRRVEWKNIELLFDTFKVLKQKFPDLVLNIAWSWTSIIKYKKYKYKLFKDINFLWELTRKQIITNLTNTSLVLFPSTIDSFWLVILESMSIWKPVIALKLDWTKELIKDWINWYLAKDNNDFINKSELLLKDNKLLQTFSIQAKNTANKYSNKNFTNQLNKIFNFIYNGN
jgi:glycosyltransferase involved in cell wall biosynthesis